MKLIKYLNETVWCKLGSSPIHGVGVFAIRDISKGQELSDNYYNSEHKVYDMTLDEFNNILPDIKALILDRTLYPKDTTTFKVFSPNNDQILQSFINHAHNANSDGIRAIRDIKRGEEITEDYTVLVSDLSELNKSNFTLTSI